MAKVEPTDTSAPTGRRLRDGLPLPTPIASGDDGHAADHEQKPAPYRRSRILGDRPMTEGVRSSDQPDRGSPPWDIILAADRTTAA
jgi:hypothetical protein